MIKLWQDTNMKNFNIKQLYNLMSHVKNIFKSKDNRLKEFGFKLLKRDFYQNRKNQVKIIAAVIVIGLIAIYLNQPKADKKYYKESVFCQTDGDCELYDCTSCGNKYWINKKVRNNNCEKTIPGLTGCVCREGICVRSYK
jgi:hypothetical protein